MSKHNIYVIELDPAALKDRKFRQANPGYLPGKPCVYVGMTARKPEERFAQHINGYKAARLAKRFGVRLKPRQFRSHNPMPYKAAVAMEREKARRLRAKGWGVWQN